jgi:tetratricopeptide (TPR) repeat protein
MDGEGSVRVGADATPDDLAKKAASERVAGRLDAAEGYARRGLGLMPEHVGGLVEVARVEVARAKARQGLERAEHLGRASRLYELAARALGARREVIAEEQAEALVDAAGVEVEAGRVTKAEAWLDALAVVAPSRLEARRRSLHERLAEAWTERGLEGPAVKAIRFAERLGSSTRVLDEAKTRAKWLAETSARAQRDDRFGSLKAAMSAELEDDAEGWRRLSRWCSGLADHVCAEWAARTALSHEPGERGQVVLAEVLSRAKRWEDAFAAWGAAGDGPEVLASAIAAFARGAPRVREVELRERFGASLVEWVKVRPERWKEAVSLTRQVGEERFVPSIARLGRKADPEAVLVELRALERVGDGAALDEPLDAAVANIKTVDEGFELVRLLLVRRDRARLERLGVGADSGLLALSEAAVAVLDGDATRARAGLEKRIAALSDDAKDEVRVRWAEADVLPDKGLRGLEAAKRRLLRARGEDRPGRLRDVARMALEVHSRAPQRAADEVNEWLESVVKPEDADVVLARAALSLKLGDEVHVGLLGLLERSGEKGRDAERLALLRKLGLALEWEEAIAAQVRTADSPRSVLENHAEKARQDQWFQGALGLYGRLHPAELVRFEVLPDLARLALMSGEFEFAAIVADAMLARGKGAPGVAARFVVLGDLMLESGDDSRAVAAFSMAVEGGERSSRAMLGLVRAIARSRGEGLETAINRWLDVRAKDARAVDELVRALVDEGEPERAIAVLKARMAASEKFEASHFGALAELYRDKGDLESLETLARAFIASDTRTTPRTIATSALKLVEAGARASALKLVEEGLAQRPRDPTLLGAAKAILIANRPKSGDKALEDIAVRLATDGQRQPEVLDKLALELRSAGHADVARRVIEVGLSQQPDAVLLTVSRGRLELASGSRSRALEDLRDSVDRAEDPLAVADTLEPVLRDAFWPEGLVAILRAAAARVPGRSDLSMATARALLEAHRPDEAAQIFLRSAAESDRAHAVIAAEWGRAGYGGRALEAWLRGFDAVPESDARMAFDAIVGLMVSRGAHDASIDSLVQRFVASQSSLDPGSRMAIAKAYLDLGRPDDARRWLEFEQGTPTPQIALERLGVLFDLARGDAQREEAIAALGEWVSRMVVTAQAGRPTELTVGVEDLIERLLQRGEASLAILVTRQLEAALGVTPGLRFLRARAALRRDGLEAMRAALDFPVASIRGSRDALKPLAALARELEERGFVNEAHALFERLSASGTDRELLLGRLRVAARAGFPEVADALAQRLAVEMPALNLWLVADSLLAEGLPATARRYARRALHLGPQGAALIRVALVEALSARGADIGSAARVEAALAQVPRLRGRVGERAIARGQVLAQLAGADGELERDLVDALASLSPSLVLPQSDPAVTKVASEVAATLESVRPGVFAQTLDALMTPQTDLNKFLRGLASEVATAGHFEASAEAYERLLELEPNDLRLMPSVAARELLTAEPSQVEASAERALEASADVPMAARFALASLGASRLDALLAERLATPLPEPLQHRLSPFIALARGDFGALRRALPEALEHAPDPELLRLELAGQILGTTPPDRQEPASLALEILSPVLAEPEKASREALSLGIAARLRAYPEDGTEADVWLSVLVRRFPGRLAEPSLLLDAALEGRDGRASARLGELLALAPKEAFTEVLAARRIVGRSASQGLEALLDKTANDVALEAELLHALGRTEEALKRVSEGRRQGPEAELFAVEWLVALGRAGQAESALDAVSARTSRGWLFEAEARLLGAPLSAALRRSEAVVAVAAGRDATLELARAVGTSPIEHRDALRLLQAKIAPSKRRGALVDCISRARAPWAGWCRHALER